MTELQLKKRNAVSEKVDALKALLEGDDTEAIKKATEELTEAFHPIAQKNVRKSSS